MNDRVQEEQGNDSFIDPLTPRSNFVILLTVNHTILIMLVQRI